MATELTAPKTDAPVKSDAEIRKGAIAAYYDAKTAEAKAAVVKQFPFLEQVFSVGNHS